MLKGDEVSVKTGEFYGKRKREGDWRRMRRELEEEDVTMEGKRE